MAQGPLLQSVNYAGLAPAAEWSEARGRGGAGLQRPSLLARCSAPPVVPAPDRSLARAPRCPGAARFPLNAARPLGPSAPDRPLQPFPPPASRRAGRRPRSSAPPARRAPWSRVPAARPPRNAGAGGRPRSGRRRAEARRACSMEVCYQLPVLPLDRPVPQHVLSRRGAISFSSSSALFGCPHPRQLSQVTAAPGPAPRGSALLSSLGGTRVIVPGSVGWSVRPSLDGQPFTLSWAQCPRTLRPPPRPLLARHARG